MNNDRIEGRWKQIKGKVKEQWGRLTDDDLDVIAGRRDQLLGRIQQRHGPRVLHQFVGQPAQVLDDAEGYIARGERLQRTRQDGILGHRNEMARSGPPVFPGLSLRPLAADLGTGCQDHLQRVRMLRGVPAPMLYVQTLRRAAAGTTCRRDGFFIL